MIAPVRFSRRPALTWFLLIVLCGCVPSQPSAPPRIIRASDQQAPTLIGINDSHSIGRPGKAPLEFQKPAGLAVDSRGWLYVADAGNHRVQVISPEGRFVDEYGHQGWRTGEFDEPLDVYVRDGALYVADTGNNRVQACRLSDTIFRVVAAPDTPVALNAPHGLAVDAAGALYIAEARQHRCLKLDATGKPQFILGSYGVSEEQFQFPTGLALDARRHLLVADSENHRVQQFDFSGTFIRSWGRPGSRPSEFRRPVALTVDRWQRVYVVDQGNRRIQIFDVEGNFLHQFTHPALQSPAGIAVDAAGVIYVSDSAAERILVFESVFQTSPDSLP